MDERSLDYVVEVIQHYATSLRHGHRHAYESLPRMLTLWFDVGAAAAFVEVVRAATLIVTLTFVFAADGDVAKQAIFFFGFDPFSFSVSVSLYLVRSEGTELVHRF